MRPCICREHRPECDCEDGNGVRDLRSQADRDFDAYIRSEDRKTFIMFFGGVGLCVGSMTALFVTGHGSWALLVLASALFIGRAVTR